MSFDLKILFVCYNGNSLPAWSHLSSQISRQIFNSGYWWLFYSGEMWSISKVFYIQTRPCSWWSW